MTLMEATAGTVLVVDDEDIVREVVCTYLEREGYSTLQASAGRAAALALIESERPDLIVLDVMLPEIDGYSILAELRKRDDIPVILLTARTEETDRVLGLELGADDYVVKPFSPRELAARVRTVLRRAGRSETPPPAESLVFDGLEIDGRSQGSPRRRAAGRTHGEGVRPPLCFSHQPRDRSSRGVSCSNRCGSRRPTGKTHQR